MQGSGGLLALGELLEEPTGAVLGDGAESFVLGLLVLRVYGDGEDAEGLEKGRAERRGRGIERVGKGEGGREGEG